jgi:hypothetical protein
MMSTYTFKLNLNHSTIVTLFTVQLDTQGCVYEY